MSVCTFSVKSSKRLSSGYLLVQNANRVFILTVVQSQMAPQLVSGQNTHLKPFISVAQQIMKHAIRFTDIALVAWCCIRGTYSGTHFCTELPFSVQPDTLLKHFTGK